MWIFKFTGSSYKTSLVREDNEDLKIRIMSISIEIKVALVTGANRVPNMQLLEKM